MLDNATVKVKAPTLPININSAKINLLNQPRVGVIPKVKPTVEIAEIVSYIIELNEIVLPSAIQIIIEDVIINNIARSATFRHF